MRTNTEYTEAVEMENRREGPDKDTQKKRMGDTKKRSGRNPKLYTGKNY